MTPVAGRARAEEPSAATKSHGAWIFLRDILLIILAAVIISFLIKTFLIRPFFIPSLSMENTLNINDRILVNELVPEVVGIQRGDIVVFTDPGNWLPPQPPSTRSPVEEGVDAALGFVGLTAPDSNNQIIKRVIGLPGDTVECCADDGRLSVNGVAIDEPYIVVPEGSINAKGIDFDVTVPEGFLWVMGDNRYDSADSAYHHGDADGGFVAVDTVVGGAFLITWPVSHWGWLDNYSETFEGVDPK